LRTVFDFAKLRAQVKGLEAQTKESSFWDNSKEAAIVQKKLSNLQEEINLWDGMKVEVEELSELQKNSQEDKQMQIQIQKRVQELEKQYEKEEFRIFLSEPQDKNDAFLTIHAGAGGLDAQDWAQMLFNMYQKYLGSKGYNFVVGDVSYGEEKGIKEASLEISGLYAYGSLRGETGVHRLIRISPYSAQKLRHTSFAMVEVLPQLEELQKDFEIPQEDLRIDTYRASGPGGQNVNTRSTAVRITHTPTGISASSQSERSQAVNRQRALELLHSKLFMLKIKKRKKELKELKGKDVAIEWGSQIRSYVMHPYQLVKDHRTNIESHNVEAVLNGQLGEFIDAEIKQL